MNTGHGKGYVQLQVNILTPVRATMIAEFIVGYELDVGDFLAWELRVWALGGKKFLLAYPCMIKKICLVVGVLELHDIDEIL